MVKKLKDWFADNTIIFISYGAALLLLTVVFIILKISPFGNINILKIDLFHAYAPELLQFRDTVYEGRSFFHTWTGALGSNAFAIHGFHILSPFTLIILLFPRVNITESIAVMLLLKIPFSALTMSFLLKNKFNGKDYTVVLFSVIFAFCSFVTAYYWSYPWLDVYFTIPLVMLGIDRLVREDKKLLYCLSLAYGIFSYFYMAAFLCMFAVLYFTASIVLENIYKDKKILIKKIINFSIYSLISGFITLFVNLPIIIYMFSTLYLQAKNYTTLGFFNIFKFITSHFFYIQPALTEATEISGPHVYIGLLPLILMPFYYLNKKIPKKEKIVYTAMLGVLFLCMEVNVLNFIVHLNHRPAGLPYRISFVYSFIMLLMAFRVYNCFDEKKKGRYASIFGAGFLLLIILYIFNSYDYKLGYSVASSITFPVMILNITVCGVYLFLLYMLFNVNKKNKRVLTIIVCVFVTFELAASAAKNIGEGTNLKAGQFYSEVKDDMEKVTAKFDAETEFYRSSFHRNHSTSDSRIYNMRDMTQFIAPTNGEATEFFKKIGIRASINNIVFLDPTPFLQSIFAFKYNLTRNYQLADPIYPLTETVGKINIYENPNVLPVGFMVKKETLGFDINTGKSAFALQGDLVRLMTGEENEMYFYNKPISCTAEYATITKWDETNFSYEVLKPNDLSKVPKIAIEYIAGYDGRVYLRYFPSGCENVKVYADGAVKKELTSTQFVSTQLDVGYIKKGTNIKIVFSMIPIQKKLHKIFDKTGTINLHLVQLEMDNYLKNIEILKREPLIIDHFDDETLHGTVNASQDGVLFTSVVYDPCWRIKVDGDVIIPEKISNTFIAIPLSAGTHEISLSYHQNGLIEGFAVTVFCVLLLSALTLIDKSRRKKQLKI